MRFLPTRIHGAIDYLWGVALMLSPYALGFSDGLAEHLVAGILGLGAIVYALFTAYELGLVRLLPMRVHLALDVLGGAFLAASPWLFGFAERGVYLPHLLFGLFAIAAGFVTRLEPGWRESVAARS